jgi:hypothetical protein
MADVGELSAAHPNTAQMRSPAASRPGSGELTAPLDQDKSGQITNWLSTVEHRTAVSA